MNGSDPKPLILLRFEAIEAGKVRDASGNGRDGTVHGNPQVVADDRLGSCLQLDGVYDWIELPAACFPGGAGFTLSFWAPGALSGTKGGYMFTSNGATSNDGGVVLSSSGGKFSIYYYYAGEGASEPVLISRDITSDEAQAPWAHWAVTRDDSGVVTIYRDGAAWETMGTVAGAVPTAAAVSLGSRAGGSSPYKGKLAAFRLYDQAQTPGQIAHDIQDDQTAVSSFRKSYPIDFGLHDDRHQRVLYITDDPAGHPMHVDIANAAGQTIQFVAPAAANAAAGPDNFHLALRFRPGTLAASFFNEKTAAALRSAVQPLNGNAATDGWDAATGRAPDGTDSLYFLSKTRMELDFTQVLKITLPNLSADGAGGARGTRVQLDFSQLRFADDPTPVSGSRISYLSILNETGAPDAPLHAGFVGNGDILNDGSANSLVLRITNITSSDDFITLNPSGKPLRPSRSSSSRSTSREIKRKSGRWRS